MTWNKICADYHGLEYYVNFEELKVNRRGYLFGREFNDIYYLEIQKDKCFFLNNHIWRMIVLTTMDNQPEREVYLAYKKWLISKALKEKLCS